MNFKVFKKLFLITFLGLIMFFGFLAFQSLNTYAVDTSTSVYTTYNGTATGGTCTITTTVIKWTSLFTISSFWPIVPDTCAVTTTASGSVQLQALPINILPVIALRLYGFICSLAFYLLFPLFLFNGLYYIWGGVNSGQIETAKKNMINSFIAVCVLASFYVVVFGVISLLGGVSKPSVNTPINTTDCVVSTVSGIPNSCSKGSSAWETTDITSFFN
jgi:hypothetical protein